MRPIAGPVSLGLAAALLTLAGPGCSAPPDDAAPAPRHWNVLLISVDTLRADHVGCYGYRRPTTPALDALAGEGIRFEEAFSPASWTLPAHMSLMTSRHPHLHGVDQQQNRLGATTATLAERLREHGYRTGGFVTWFYVAGRYREYLPDAPDPARSVRAERVVDDVAAWLAEPSDRPFFGFVHLFDPHMDYDPPPPYDGMFDAGYAGAVDGRHETLRPHIRGVRGRPTDLARADIEHVVALYDGEIRFADDQIARLLSRLGELGLDETTIVVVTSDHGEEFAEHGSMEGHQWTLYDEVLRVPLIVRHPAVPGPRVVRGPVDLLDVAPTLLEWLGLPRPEGFHGRSLAGALESGSSDPDHLLFSEIRRFNYRWAVRGAGHKLILTGGPERNALGQPVRRGYELYDLEADPGETTNLVESRPDVVRRLGSELIRFIESVGDAATDQPDDEVTFTEEELERLRSLGYVQ
jgi:arylsulfatase A-like enzyme